MLLESKNFRIYNQMQNSLKFYFLMFIFNLKKKYYFLCGLGIGDWGLGPIPNPQSPIPNPQSPLIIYQNKTNIKN